MPIFQNVSKFQTFQNYLATNTLHEISNCKTLVQEEEIAECINTTAVIYNEDQDEILEDVSDQRVVLDTRRVEAAAHLANITVDIQAELDANIEYARVDLVTCVENTGPGENVSSIPSL